MALQLMKLHVLVSSVSTNLNPEVTSFFHVTTVDTEGGATLTLDPADFFQDDGTEVTELPELATDNSYFNVYVNGVLQMSELSTYTPGAAGIGSLVINVPEDDTPILANSPIVLKVVNFNPSTDASVET